MEENKKATEISIHLIIYVPVSEERNIQVKTLCTEEIEALVPELGNLLRDAGYDYQIWEGEAQDN